MAILGKRYPQTWRIDDWDKPWLPAPIRWLNKMPESLACKLFPLTEESLFTAARNYTGLSDFGDEDFLAPFRLVLSDISPAHGFTPMGRMTAQTILQQQLRARLCVEDRIKKNPRIVDENIPSSRIVAPIIIAGLPRTGTTHLHNLLSEVDSLRFIPLWQTLLPTQNPNVKHDWRRRETDFYMLMTYYILPLFRRMHEMITDMPHEELTLCALCYRSFFFEGSFRAPRYREWYANTEHSKGYRYLKKILQIFQAEGLQQGKTADSRWVLKSPQHVDQLPAILNVFPDARIVLTHRDPARAVLSMVTMMLYTRRQMYGPQHRLAEAREWVDRLETMLRASQQQAQQLPASQLMHVNFDEFMQHPQDTIEQVLAFANVELTERSRQAIATHLQHHVRDLHGRIDYRFEDHGLNEAEIRERFSFYQY